MLWLLRLFGRRRFYCAQATPPANSPWRRSKLQLPTDGVWDGCVSVVEARKGRSRQRTPRQHRSLAGTEQLMQQLSERVVATSDAKPIDSKLSYVDGGGGGEAIRWIPTISTLPV